MLTGNEALRKKADLVTDLKKDGNKGMANLRATITGNLNKSIKPEDLNKLIDGTEVYEIKQKNGTINYTYRIKHPDATKLIFFNVLVKFTQYGKKTELVKYEMTQQFATDFYAGSQSFERFSGTVTMETIMADAGYPCDDTPTVPIPVSGGVGGGGNGAGSPGAPPGTGTTTPPWGTGNGSNPGSGGTSAYHAFVNAQYQGMQMYGGTRNNTGDGDDEGSGDDEGTGETGTPPGQDHYHHYYLRTAAPSIDNPADPCDDGHDVGILEPPTVTDEDNCSDLTTKSYNPDFDTKLNDLIDKAATQNFESAYTMYQNAGLGLLFSNEAVGTSAAPEVSLNLAQSQTQATVNAVGFMHCHLDNGSTFKIFSFSDLIAMAQLASVSTRPTSELVMYVVTTSGTFALKVSDKIALKNNLQRMQLGANSYELDFESYVSKDQTVEQQIIGFLKFIKAEFSDTGLGVDLYQLKNDGNWEKIKLNANNRTVTRKSC